MVRRMVGQTDGRRVRQTNEHLDGWMVRRTEGRRVRRTDERMVGRMDGWFDGRADGLTVG